MSDKLIIEVHLFNHGENSEQTKLTAILVQQGNIMTAIEQLTADVAANGVVIDSAVQLITGIKAQLDAAIAAGDPAALTALSAQLESESAALAAAVAANTPAVTP